MHDVVTVYLHWMSSTAALELSFPRLFFATHRYSPLSLSLEFNIVKVLFFPENLILELPLATNKNPSLVQDIIGSGFPSALQEKVTLSPSVFVAPCGCAVIVGGSMNRNNRNIKHRRLTEI